MGEKRGCSQCGVSSDTCGVHQGRWLGDGQSGWTMVLRAAANCPALPSPAGLPLVLLSSADSATVGHPRNVQVLGPLLLHMGAGEGRGAQRLLRLIHRPPLGHAARGGVGVGAGKWRRSEGGVVVWALTMWQALGAVVLHTAFHPSVASAGWPAHLSTNAAWSGVAAQLVMR